jgi:hypothetical protein
MSYREQEPVMEGIDPLNVEVHKVGVEELEQYKAGVRGQLRADCGKVWSPALPMSLYKPQCEKCFPPKPRYAIAV